MPKHTVIKKFGHEQGYSCCFRQHAAESHCRFLHGYALAFEFTIGADELDPNGWVYDFGQFGEVKRLLKNYFDHKLVIAHDDPDRNTFIPLHASGVVDVITLPRVGCEAFARFVFEESNDMITASSGGRAWVHGVVVSEHNGNSVRYGR